VSSAIDRTATAQARQEVQRMASVINDAAYDAEQRSLACYYILPLCLFHSPTTMFNSLCELFCCEISLGGCEDDNSAMMAMITEQFDNVM